MPRSILIYAIFLVFITVFSYFFVDQNLTYLKHFYTGFSTTHRLLASSIFFLIIVIHFIFYIVFLRRIKRGTINFKLIVFCTPFFLFCSYPLMFPYITFNSLITSKVFFGHPE